jgi:hypothetical protein
MRGILAALLVAVCAPGAPDSAYSSAGSKIASIEAEKAPAGSRVVLSLDELNAYARGELAATEGIREPRLELGTGRATGYALVDFPKLRRAMGQPMGWFLEKLLAGERSLRVDARITSGGGKATVFLELVEISGVAIKGETLDYLIRNYLWAYYPEATVNRPFELAHRIDRIEIDPSAVAVVIGK